MNDGPGADKFMSLVGVSREELTAHVQTMVNKLDSGLPIELIRKSTPNPSNLAEVYPSPSKSIFLPRTRASLHAREERAQRARGSRVLRPHRTGPGVPAPGGEDRFAIAVHGLQLSKASEWRPVGEWLNEPLLP